MCTIAGPITQRVKLLWTVYLPGFIPPYPSFIDLINLAIAFVKWPLLAPLTE